MKYPTVKECIKSIILATISFIVMIVLISLVSVFKASAQNVKRQGNTFIEQVDTTQTKTLKGTVYETDYIYVDRQGNAYNVYLSSNGNAFIVKVSKKSGRKYRKYLPEITKEIQRSTK